MSNFRPIGAAALMLLATACGHKTPATAVVPVGPTDPVYATVAATTTAPSPATRTVASDKGGFSCQCPVTWQTHSGDATVTLVPASDPTGALDTLTLDVPWLPPHFPGMITIARVEKGFLDDLRKKMQNVVVDVDRDQSLPDSKARRVHVHAKTAQGDRVIDAVLAIHDDRVYVLDAETAPAEADDAHQALEAILASWHWTK